MLNKYEITLKLKCMQKKTKMMTSNTSEQPLKTNSNNYEMKQAELSVFLSCKYNNYAE